MNQLLSQIGQWSEAEFGSPERTDKFRRLMGAYKETSNRETGANSPSSSRHCMTKGSEELLTERLQQQYDSAMDYVRDRRGLGLGYNPDEDPKNKIFYIDKSASKSVSLEPCKSEERSIE